MIRVHVRDDNFGNGFALKQVAFNFFPDLFTLTVLFVVFPLSDVAAQS